MTGSFTFDANKCTGCGACRVACTIENDLAPDVSWRRIETFNPQRRSMAPVFHLSLACNHCATAACMNACPALAYRRDEATRAVLLDSNLCIGCGYCSWACPYDAPVFDENAGVMTKCTWCADRLRAGLKPSCTVHCPTGALGFGEVSPEARLTALWGLPVTDLQPNLHVTPLDGSVPVMTAGSDGVPGPLETTPSSSRTAGAQPGISLRREWPLAVFTFGAAVLVALVCAGAAGAIRIAAPAFVVVAAAVMGIAGAHLGRKERAWRAVLNVRRSWLSREIVTMTGFIALATLWMLVLPESRALGWLAAAVGFAGLFCADSVYGVLADGPGYRRSAGVTTTGALLAGTIVGAGIVVLPVLALKAWMFFQENGRRGLTPSLAAVRVMVGFVAPAVLWPIDRTHAAPAACILLGEAIARCEYYMELRRHTPRGEMNAALARLDLARD